MAEAREKACDVRIFRYRSSQVFNPCSNPLLNDKKRSIFTKRGEEFYITHGALKYWADRSFWIKRAVRERFYFADFARQHHADSICDLGCGTGYLAFLLAEATDASCIVGVDILKPAIALARRFLRDFYPEFEDRIAFEARDWRTLEGLTTAPFDLMLCVGSSLHHEPRDCCDSLFIYWRSFVRKGGHIIIEQRNYDNIFRIGKQVIPTSYGQTAEIEVCGSHDILFRYKADETHSEAVIYCEVLFARELIERVQAAGFVHLQTFYDYKNVVREDAAWVQFVFKAI